MGDDRVDAAERGGQLGDGQRIDERSPAGPAADDLEGEHPAADRELARGQGVLRVAGQARVEHPQDGRLGLEPGGQDPGRRSVALHPDGQRGQAAQDQEGRQR